MFVCMYRALEAASHLGGKDLEPFYALIEGGRYGEFYAEMEQFFYYAQIKRYRPHLILMETLCDILCVCMYISPCE